MPATGVSGLDLYVKTESGPWRWVAVGQPQDASTSTVTLVSGLPEGKREFLLYLPLYNGVSAVEIGIPGDRKLEKGAPRPASHRPPIVFYGTSITQGGCASRPGMAHTAILGRRLDRPVINLGFSGNGLMEPEMATLLAELDPAVYVLDCLPNMTAELVTERVEPFVRTLRKARPSTPIVLAEDRTYSNAPVVPEPLRTEPVQPCRAEVGLRTLDRVRREEPALPARRDSARRRRRGHRRRLASHRPGFLPDGRGLRKVLEPLLR